MLNPRINERSQTTEIESKFGRLTLDLSKSFSLPQGIIGMPEAKNFCLAACPAEKFANHFHVLQSTDYTDLCFLVRVIPDYKKTTFYDKKHVEVALKENGINTRNLLMFNIAGTKMDNASKRLTLNLRAPVFIDTQAYTGTQHVFNNEIYSFQHEL